MTAGWSYHTAFLRNRGLVTEWEQWQLRHSRVAIAGMGGVGGTDLITLARLGAGRFTIADPGRFEVVNTNRQYGATAGNVGRLKVEVMAEAVRQINPEANVRVMAEAIGEDNVDAFLKDATLFIDAMDVFAMRARRLAFRRAATDGLYGITGGPLGFGAAWLVFDPNGMSFDRYFDLRDEMESVDQFIAFAVGVAPRATYRAYLNLDYVDLRQGTGPSSICGCEIAAAAVGVQAVKILLWKGTVRPAPWYHQFDPWTNRFFCRYLWGGNRHPLQRVKRWLLKKRLSM